MSERATRRTRKNALAYVWHRFLRQGNRDWQTMANLTPFFLSIQLVVKRLKTPRRAKSDLAFQDLNGSSLSPANVVSVIMTEMFAAAALSTSLMLHLSPAPS